MPAIVPELIDMASDPAIATTDLLRRALVVARRLRVPDLIDWINSELNGFTSGELPEYRLLRGESVAENPYHGIIPFFVPPEIADLMAQFPVRQSIPELIHLLGSEHGIFHHYPASIEQNLMNMMRQGSGVAMRPALKFSTVQIQGVIETVRSRILDWALDLEERGVLGEGMTFSPMEKQIVQEQHYNFNNVSGSQIQIGSDGSTQTQTNAITNDLAALKSLIGALGDVLDQKAVVGSTADELRAELATLKAQASSPKPKWEVIKATARSIKTIGEGAAGNILGELAKPQLAALIALAAS